MPPLTSDAVPELISGAAAAAGPQQTRRVRVVRPFMLGGQAQPVGAEVELPRWLAADLLGAGKAEPVDPVEPVAAPAPAAPELPQRRAPARPARATAG